MIGIADIEESIRSGVTWYCRYRENYIFVEKNTHTKHQLVLEYINMFYACNHGLMRWLVLQYGENYAMEIIIEKGRYLN